MNGFNLIGTERKAPWVTALGLCTLLVSAGAHPNQTSGDVPVDSHTFAMAGVPARQTDQETTAKPASAPASFQQNKIPALDSTAQGSADNLLVALDAGLSDRDPAGNENRLFSLLKPQQAPAASFSIRDNRPAPSAVSWSAAVGKPVSGKLSTLAVDESGQVVAPSRDQSDSSLLPHGDLGKFALVPTNFYALVVNPSDEEDVWVQDHLSDHPFVPADNEALLATVFGDASGYSSTANTSLVSASFSPESLLQAQVRPVRAAGDVIDLTGNLLANNGQGTNVNVSASNVGLSLLDRGMMTQMTLANQAGNAISVVTVKNVAAVPEPNALALIACTGALAAAYAGVRKFRSSAA